MYTCTNGKKAVCIRRPGTSAPRRYKVHGERELDRRSKRRDEGSRSITEKFKGINYGQAAGSSQSKVVLG